jgi:diaminopimelate decarboxylase
MEADWQIPGYLEARDQHLTLDGLDLVALAAQRDTPLYVYSARRIVETARNVRRAFDSRHPKAVICYASKALSAIKVLRLLRACGLSIEVNSGGELFRAKRAGFEPGQIVFNGVSKTAQELRDALSPPIKAINVDSLFELSRIIEVARAARVRANIALRLVPEVDTATSPGNKTGSERSKFGIRQREMAAACAMIRDAGDCVLTVGLHGHIGSQITSTAPFAAAAARLADLFRELQRGVGHPLDHINIGGGFPLTYLRGAPQSAEPPPSPESPLSPPSPQSPQSPQSPLAPQGGIFSPRIDVEDIAAAVMPILLSKLGPRVEVLVEPGRRLVGDSAVMLSRVENTKERSDGRWLYLDAGYNTLVESYTYKWYYQTLTANKLREPFAEFRVAGPLCDNGDAFFDVDGEQTLERVIESDPAFADKRALLESLLVRLPRTRHLARSTAPGDLIAFLDAGAYTLDQITPNNGRPRPEVGLIDGAGRYDILRRRDTLSDLLYNEAL